MFKSRISRSKLRELTLEKIMCYRLIRLYTRRCLTLNERAIELGSYIVITGYNTDVEHGGVVYHVQTEDKGIENPIVMSLVYAGGAILAARRSSYADLITTGFEEAALAERLRRQHRLICAAIHAGRIDELRQLSKPQTDRRVAEPTTAANKPESVPSDSLAAEPTKTETEITVPSVVVTEPAPAAPLLKAAPARLSVVTSQPAEGQTEPLIGNDRVLDPSPVSRKTTGSSPYTVYDSRRRSRLGEVISEPDGLKITLIGHGPDFRGGENIELKAILTRISDDVEEPLSGAAISVKVLGTTFRPVLLSVKTDREGVMSVSTRIPPFTSGRAAIVVKAAAGDLSTEARWVVHPGK